jgi:hypothetical protein
MRILAMTGLIFLLCAVGLSREPNKSANVAKNKGDNQPPAPTITLVNNQASAPDTKHGPDHAPRWYASPEWWLVILGFPTLFFIGVQSVLLRRSADAALLNAQALVNSERAWVLAKVSSPERSHTVFDYTCSLHNHGRTPARVERLSFNVVYPETLKELPDYGIHDGDELPIMLAPNEPWKFGNFNPSFSVTEEGWKKVNDGTGMLAVIGIVVYKDIFTTDIHYTKFCFVYDNNEGCFLMGGPVEYNSYT